jgi:hypothetical protein
MMALALLLLPGLGTGVIQAGTPSYGAFSQTTRAVSNMTCSDQSLDSDSSCGVMNVSQMILTEITGKLSSRNKQFYVGSIRLDLSPCRCLRAVNGFNDLDVYKTMVQVLHRGLGREITVIGLLSGDGAALMLASIAGETYREPTSSC